MWKRVRMVYGEQYLELDAALQAMQPAPDGSEISDMQRTTMELREQLPTMTEVRNLEEAGICPLALPAGSPAKLSRDHEVGTGGDGECDRTFSTVYHPVDFSSKS